MKFSQNEYWYSFSFPNFLFLSKVIQLKYFVVLLVLTHCCIIFYLCRMIRLVCLVLIPFFNEYILILWIFENLDIFKDLTNLTYLKKNTYHESIVLSSQNKITQKILEGIWILMLTYQYFQKNYSLIIYSSK